MGETFQKDERTEAAGGFLLVLFEGLSGSHSLPRLEVLVLKKVHFGKDK